MPLFTTCLSSPHASLHHMPLFTTCLSSPHASLHQVPLFPLLMLDAGCPHAQGHVLIKTRSNCSPRTLPPFMELWTLAMKPDRFLRKSSAASVKFISGLLRQKHLDSVIDLCLTGHLGSYLDVSTFSYPTPKRLTVRGKDTVIQP